MVSGRGGVHEARSRLGAAEVGQAPQRARPGPGDWEDRDLTIGLSRAYRWDGHSRWGLPMSVAQHSLLVLMLRQQMQPHAPLSRSEALRELLHDGHEGFLSLDPISPLKPHLGSEFEDVAGRLQAVSSNATACRRGSETTTCCTSGPIT